MPNIEQRETVDAATEWDLTHGVGPKAAPIDIERIGEVPPPLAPPDTIGQATAPGASFQDIMTNMLSSGRPADSTFDPTEEERPFEDSLGPVALEQAGDSVTKNAKTEATRGEQPDRSQTGAQGKVQGVLDTIALRDEAFPKENKGKLMGALAGTILQMIGLNNNSPGLFLAGGTISSLAQKELQNWNNRWDAVIAKELETPDTATTQARQKRDAVVMQKYVDSKKAAPKTDPEAHRALLEMGFPEEDITPEKKQILIGMTPGAEITRAEGAREATVKGLQPQAENIATAEWAKTGELEVLRGKDTAEQEAKVTEWLHFKMTEAEADPALREQYSLLLDRVPEMTANMFGKGVRKRTELVAPGDVRDRAKSFASTTETTEASGFYTDASGLTGESDEEILATDVEITPDMSNKIPILSNLSPGPRKYGAVQASIRDTLPDEVFVSKDKESGNYYAYIHTEPPVFEQAQSAFVPIPQAPRRARNKVKVIASDVNSNPELWKAQLQKVIDTGSGYDSQYESYIRMLTTSMRGTPGSQ